MPRAFGFAAVQRDPAEPDALHALRLQPGQPGVVGLEVAGGAVRAGVLQPELDVGGRVEHLALHHDSLTPGVEPVVEALIPRLLGDGPVGQHLAPPVRTEPGRRSADDRLDDRVTGHAGIAVHQPRARPGGDDERGVGRDQIDRLLAERLEQRPIAHLDVAEPVERGVEPGHPQGPRVDVAGDHPLAMRGQVQGLHAAPGAQIHRQLEGLAQRQLGQARRGLAEAEHVVLVHLHRGAVHARGQVGQYPQVGAVRGVRAHVHQRPGLLAGHGEHTSVDEWVDEARQRTSSCCRRHRPLQEEESDQGRQGVVRAVHPPCPRGGLVAKQALVGALAEPGEHRVVTVVDRLEGIAEPTRQILGHPPSIRSPSIEHRSRRR